MITNKQTDNIWNYRAAIHISKCLTFSSIETKLPTVTVVASMDELEMYEEPEFDAETQARLDTQVDKLLKGYDWTLAPLANR